MTIDTVVRAAVGIAPKAPVKYFLFNVVTNELLQIGADSQHIAQAVELVLRHRLAAAHFKDDAKFVEDCLVEHHAVLQLHMTHTFESLRVANGSAVSGGKRKDSAVDAPSSKYGRVAAASYAGAAILASDRDASF
jgi:hypothetical protein